jgi:hypothetical protein
MTGETLLLRQIHPNFVQNGRVTSQAFRPSPKDESQLSVDNGDMVTPEASWNRFSAQPENSSAGVMAISHSECSNCHVDVIEDGVPYPEHCYLDYSPFGRKESDRKGKKLAVAAHSRGWLFEAK